MLIYFMILTCFYKRIKVKYDWFWLNRSGFLSIDCRGSNSGRSWLNSRDALPKWATIKKPDNFNFVGLSGDPAEARTRDPPDLRVGMLYQSELQ